MSHYEDWMEGLREKYQVVDPNEKYKPVPRGKHESAADALFAVLENLYESRTNIDETSLKEDLAYLCDCVGLDDSQLRDHRFKGIHRAEAKDLYVYQAREIKEPRKLFDYAVNLIKEAVNQ